MLVDADDVVGDGLGPDALLVGAEVCASSFLSSPLVSRTMPTTANAITTKAAVAAISGVRLDGRFGGAACGWLPYGCPPYHWLWGGS